VAFFYFVYYIVPSYQTACLL